MWGVSAAENIMVIDANHFFKNLSSWIRATHFVVCYWSLPTCFVSWIGIKHWCIPKNVNEDNRITVVCISLYSLLVWEKMYIGCYSIASSSVDTFEGSYSAFGPWNPMDLHNCLGT